MLLASEVGARMPYFRHIPEKNGVLFLSFTDWREGTPVPGSR